MFKQIIKEVKGYELDKEKFESLDSNVKAVVRGIDNLLNLKSAEKMKFASLANRFVKMSPKQQRAVVKAMSELNLALDDLLDLAESR